MEKRNIIVIGASTGGVEALKQLVQELPSDLNASIFIVWHMSPTLRGFLPEVLNSLNTIHAANAYDKEVIIPNRIYVAPPDHHLLVEEGRVRVTRGPKENRFRPAVDPLFRSAAYAYGNRVIGVVLSGQLDDGTAGLWRVKYSGGLAVVQDPADAIAPSMPESALRELEVDYCVPVADMGALLVKLSLETINENVAVMKDEKTKIEIGIAAEENGLNRGSLNIGELSRYACPDCHGILSKIMDGNIVRFRCHTGHAYSADTLMAALTENIEDSLYSAIRGMDESILMLNQTGDHYAEANQLKLAAIYFKKAKEAEERSELIRKAVHRHQQLSRDIILEDAEQSL
ncbi:chemotaxis protein CheB [Mucilaginibacter psychrotolerans]|uniref:protein-glutamate methylesterase n=1 Tax=Mucilaginibacter psychrotolerans TaxID=1524096 RepID=A0A4Y8RZ89_9SPHI|nr:chemotaxis protein CheB [Mucilaginibacter psychrotolerans]TFF30351.1 chemotaxis protein CheB [Mucilaginibacter psychrotolerans]